LQPAARSGEDELVRTYLREIGRYPLLDKEGEQRLARVIEEGRRAATRLVQAGENLPGEDRERLASAVEAGDRAMETFINANLRLVVSIARRYQSSGLALLDLIQEGNLGLIHAVEKFDFRRGLKFSTYATWWIRQAVTRALANCARTIRLPVHTGEAVSRVQKAQSVLEAQLGRTPTICELAGEVSMSADKVSQALLLLPQPLSLSEPCGEDGEGELGDVVQHRGPSPLDEIIAAALPVLIRELLDLLEERERRVVCLRYGLDCGQPRTLREVSEIYGMTPEGIRSIEKRALTKLRLRSGSTGAADFLAS
jgi:RNA polymerase sigma factor (sigma-70 family)